MRPQVPPGLVPNYGSRNPFPATPVPGGFAVASEVQLISARVVDPMQWVVTLQPVTRRASQVWPWDSPWDGAAALPITGTVPQNISEGYKVRMTWGAGGIRGDAVFDYPMAGGSFSVCADTLDLKAFNPNPLAGTGIYSTVDDLPVFGAFMVPGQSASGVGMRLNDVAQSFAAGPGDTAWWAVKPYSRYLWVAQRDIANTGLYEVRFQAAGGNEVWNTGQATGAGSTDGSIVSSARGPIMVPPESTIVALTNRSASQMIWALTWEMFFA
jgi:hypothetical protein